MLTMGMKSYYSFVVLLRILEEFTKYVFKMLGSQNPIELVEMVSK